MKRCIAILLVFCFLCPVALAEAPEYDQSQYSFGDHVNVDDTLKDLFGQADDILGDIEDSMSDLSEVMDENFRMLYYFQHGYYPLMITMKLDAKSVQAGDTVSASYSMSGGSERFRAASYRWDSYVNGEWVNGQMKALKYTEGTIVSLPLTGTKARLYMEIEDTAGRKGYRYSNEVQVVGNEQPTPAPTETPDQKTARYIVEEFNYDGEYLTGNLKHVEGTGEADRLFLRVTLFLGDGSTSISVNYVDEDTLTFEAGASGNIVHISVAVTGTSRSVRADGSWKAMGSYEY